MRLSQEKCHPTGVINTMPWIEIPRGDTKEDIKTRKQIIGDFYATWNAEHPEKRVWNQSLNDYIYIKFHSLNETRGHASGTYESTKAVLSLTELLEKAVITKEKPKKQQDNNQKIFSKIVITCVSGKSSGRFI